MSPTVCSLCPQRVYRPSHDDGGPLVHTGETEVTPSFVPGTKPTSGKSISGGAFLPLGIRGGGTWGRDTTSVRTTGKRPNGLLANGSDPTKTLTPFDKQPTLSLTFDPGRARSPEEE